MNKYTINALCGLLLFSGCLKVDNEDIVDLEAPEIKANVGFSNISPGYFFTTSANSPLIPLSFMVEDDSGIREIKIESHSGFDGHSHGKSSSAKNPKFKFFTYNKVIGSEDILDTNRFMFSDSVYLDQRNPELDEDELILGGPYHFSIQATDLEGNETNYRDNTHYHTTIFLNKPYAPQVTLTETATSSAQVQGLIYRNMEHPASSDINFLWIYIEGKNVNNPNQAGTVLKERIWGQSNWPHQSRDNQGASLPGTQNLQIEELLNGDSDFLSSLQGNNLVIWAEDSNGNISVNKFNF